MLTIVLRPAAKPTRLVELIHREIPYPVVPVAQHGDTVGLSLAQESQETVMNHEKHETHEKVLYPDEAYAIQGAVFEVYREMGAGFLEAVYQECLEREFRRRGVPYRARPELPLSYKGERLVQTYKPDFICYDRIIVELKAIKEIAPEHVAQVINYLKAAEMKLGLLVNFGSHPKATIRRLVY